MKWSEAKPLSKQELQNLKSLLQRWILRTYPFHGGSSEESDAYTTFWDVERDAQKGNMDQTEPAYPEGTTTEMVAKYGENEL